MRRAKICKVAQARRNIISLQATAESDIGAEHGGLFLKEQAVSQGCERKIWQKCGVVAKEAVYLALHKGVKLG